jgi:hypothetical protein
MALLISIKVLHPEPASKVYQEYSSTVVTIQGG